MIENKPVDIISPVDERNAPAFCLWPSTLNSGNSTSEDIFTEFIPSSHLYCMSFASYPTEMKNVYVIITVIASEQKLNKGFIFIII